MKNKEKFTPEELEAIKLFANKGGTWNNDWTRKLLAHITALEREVEEAKKKIPTITSDMLDVCAQGELEVKNIEIEKLKNDKKSLLKLVNSYDRDRSHSDAAYRGARNEVVKLQADLARLRKVEACAIKVNKLAEGKVPVDKPLYDAVVELQQALAEGGE
jgi:chromosome segregation ATPase